MAEQPPTTESVFELRIYRRSAIPPGSQNPRRPRDSRLLWLAIVLSVMAIAAAAVAIAQGDYGGVLALAAVASILGAVVAVLSYVKG